MNEHEAVRALQERGRFGVRLGLGRIKALLDVLGNPERSVRGALIAGTNGKGSVQALVSAALNAGGIRVGQTPKPHLVSYRERIVVDGRPIDSPAFAALVSEVLEASERVPSRLGPPTEFEVVTAAAFTHFARARVKVGIVEVGLGGRLDATNAWDGGVAAITNVDLDHMEWLGPTIPLISKEKAAIIKRGNLAVTGADGEALDVIAAAARRAGAPLEITAPLPVVASGRDGITVRDFSLGELQVGLLGRHQAANAAVALGVLRALERRKIAVVDEDAIRRGFAGARWPGRMELLSAARDGSVRAAGAQPVPGSVDVLLDGAHNAAGAAALAAALEDLRASLSPGNATLLFGALRDKELARIARALVATDALRTAMVIATTVPDTPRALPAEEVAAAWRVLPGMTADRLEAIDSVDDALPRALAEARSRGGPLIVAGSLYLVGHVRGTLLPDPELPRS